MKKVYNFLAMFLLLFAAGTSSAWAQEEEEVIWELDMENPVTEIQTGVNYAIKHGTYSEWNSDQYLSASGAGIVTPDETCIYQFEQDGTVTDEGSSEALPVYVLRSAYNGQYVSGNNAYTLSKADALHFTALPATYPIETSGELTLTQKRAAFNSVRQPGSQDVTMIFAMAEPNTDGTFNFLCYWGNPAVSSYSDTNAWFVYSASSRTKTAFEKMQDAYNALFGDAGFDETIFVVGNTPGCVTQETYDILNQAYTHYFEVSGLPNPSDEDCLAVLAELQAAAKALETGRINVTPGYYIMLSQRSKDAAYDDGTNVRCTSNYTVPSTLTVSAARYVWEVVDAGNGRYNMRNLQTGRYIDAGAGTSVIFTTSEEASATFDFPIITGRFFAIADQNGNRGHCDASMKFVQWNSDGTGNQWEFVVVPQEQVEAVLPQIEHNKLLSDLSSLVSEAKGAQLNYLYDSDVTFDDNYASAGLADPTLMSTNAPESGEGYDVADQFTRIADGNLSTYFHSNWSGGENDPSEGYHWIQVDLGKAVQNLFVKFSDRHNNRKNTPRWLALVAPNEGEDPMGAVWGDTLYNDTIIYQYRTNYSSGALDSTTCVMRLSFDRPVQNLRFVVTKTAHPSGGMSPNGSGPFWNVSELRFYEDGGDNPRYQLIPKEVRDALEQQLAVAEAALADSSATQETYDALEAAFEAFVNAYPDPTELNNRIAEAQNMLEGAEEGDEYGYFQTGAINEFQTALNTIQTEIDGFEALTLTQLDEYLDRVNEAINAFNSKLNVPEDGVYFLRSTSTAAAGNSYVYATNAGENGVPRWGYYDEENGGPDQLLADRLDAMWYLQHQEDGTITLRNLATGRYLANMYGDTQEPDTIGLSQNAPLSLEPGSFNPVFSGTPGSFNLEFTTGYYLNADPSGPIVNWSSAGGNSNFTFESASDVFEGFYAVDVTPGRMQVMTLPFTFDGSFSEPLPYKVLGKTTEADGTYVQLAAYDGEVPAGTPFVLQADANTAQMMVGLVQFDALEFATTADYNYEVVNANGLVGALTEVVPGAGNGLLLDDMIKITDGSTQVGAGSGYFMDNIPDTDEVGELTLFIDGVINAIGGVETGEAENVDVYTLSGVKLRSNVKAADATKGLPAGLYIVGGKKVLVK